MDEELDRDAIRAKISTMSFEELQKLKEDMGAKLYNETVLNVKSNKVFNTDFKRANKNRPREMSSKRPTPVLNEVMIVKKTTVRDPRFDPLCGTFEEKTFQQNYKFVDKLKENERNILIKELEETEDEKRRKKIKFLIQRMDNQQAEKDKKDKKIKEKNSEKEERKTAIKMGEKPVYHKKSEKRMMDLLNRYEELKSSKKLKKHIEKKAKKVSRKDKMKLKPPL